MINKRDNNLKMQNQCDRFVFAFISFIVVLHIEFIGVISTNSIKRLFVEFVKLVTLKKIISSLQILKTIGWKLEFYCIFALVIYLVIIEPEKYSSNAVSKLPFFSSGFTRP